MLVPSTLLLFGGMLHLGELLLLGVIYIYYVWLLTLLSLFTKGKCGSFVLQPHVHKSQGLEMDSVGGSRAQAQGVCAADRRKHPPPTPPFLLTHQHTIIKYTISVFFIAP